MSILKAPIVTEKMTAITEKSGRYGFIVDKKANKIQIKHAIEAMYNVKVERINTMTYYGKAKSRFTKTGVQSGNANSFKKAIVEVAKGEEIDFYSNI
jgi:large subunit ribosomal protein L23